MVSSVTPYSRARSLTITFPSATSLESMAFFENDLRKLIDIGLSYIPAECRTAETVKLAIECYDSKVPFKEARETIGISKNEVIKDLNITESQLDNLEDGNFNAFKDVFFLKDTIKVYAKYLNLDEDEIVDKFNDFIFGYTSRIPIRDILDQTREINILESKSEENKIVSPYTLKRKKKSNIKYVIAYILAVIVLVILVLLIVKFLSDKKYEINNFYYNINMIGE
mgnify:CR=1 FL=1